MSPPAPRVYDPVAVFVAVFSAHRLAIDLAGAFTCTELNALVAVLHTASRRDAAEVWMSHHRHDCDDPARH